jgi:hypothetical protein
MPSIPFVRPTADQGPPSVLTNRTEIDVWSAASFTTPTVFQDKKLICFFFHTENSVFCLYSVCVLFYSIELFPNMASRNKMIYQLKFSFIHLLVA